MTLKIRDLPDCEDCYQVVDELSSGAVLPLVDIKRFSHSLVYIQPREITIKNAVEMKQYFMALDMAWAKMEKINNAVFKS